MSVEQDAAEYGAHVKHGGWRLGLLVARSVQNNGRGNPKGAAVPLGKVTATRFAELAGTTHQRVMRHLVAWERAAEAGLVPAPADLGPGDEPPLPDAEMHPWGDFYDASDAGSRPRDSRPEDAARIIERRGAQRVLAELSADAADDLADAMAASPDLARRARRALGAKDAERDVVRQQRADTDYTPQPGGGLRIDPELVPPSRQQVPALPEALGGDPDAPPRDLSAAYAAMDFQQALGAARAKLRQALGHWRTLEGQGAELADHAVEGALRDLGQVEALARLLRAAVGGDSGTDWDAELARMGGTD